MSDEKKAWVVKRQNAYRSLNRLKDVRSRNVLRGLLTSKSGSALKPQYLNAVRHLSTSSEISIATELLIGGHGVFPAEENPRDYRNIQKLHELDDGISSNDLAFVCGHLNGWKDRCLEIIQSMGEISKIDSYPAIEQLRAMQAFWLQCGISDFLNKKLVYYMNLAEVDRNVVSEYRDFAKFLDIEHAPEPYFSAMELMSERYPYFRSIRTWTDILNRYRTDDFRQHNALHNSLPVPLSRADVGSFLKKSFSMSIPDQLCALKILLSLQPEWPELANQIHENLNAEICSSLLTIERSNYSHSEITANFPEEDSAFLLYRRAPAFLEQTSLVRYRFAVDRILAPRLLPERYGITYRPLRPSSEISLLRTELLSRENSASELQVWPENAPIGSFTRTILFLEFMSEYPDNLHFSESEIKFIFENTTALQFLMKESELSSLYDLSSDSGRLVISTLALAIYKEQQDDEDIDFKFRYALQKAIIDSFEGSVSSFLRSISEDSPSIAHFLAGTLDRTTIQKLYLVVKSAEQADLIHQDILRQLGEKLNYLPYLVEADRIRAHNQLSKLKTEIDDSRVFVDTTSLKRWIRENPSAYIKEYRRLIEHSIESLTRAAVVIRDDQISLLKAEISVISSFDYILTRAMETVFEQFCTNHSFGIDSYLGRRIRHNTLHGMMLGGVDSIILGYPALRADGQYMFIYNEWLASYKSMIDHLRIEIIQFRSDQKKAGIFFSSIDASEQITISNIADLRKALMLSGVLENFEDRVVRFCWDQFEPQLKAAQIFISRDTRLRAIETLDTILGVDASSESRKFVAELRASVHDRLITLSSWFQVPGDRSLSATLQQISDLITIECEQAIERSLSRVKWNGADLESVISGSSVHKLYDCLFVLIFNAYRHGSRTESIEGHVDRHTRDQGRALEIRITSWFADASQRSEQVRRIEDLLKSSNNLSTAMIKEGYSGLRKLMYLTSEGGRDHNVYLSCDNEKLTLGFSTTVEVEDGTPENTPRGG